MISIIVCTYKRPDLVANLLRDLEVAAIHAPDGWELIIIDNHGDDHTKEICGQSSIETNNLKYFYEAKAGLSAARNRAVIEASGQWLLFLDDDVRVSADFIENMLVATEKTSVGVICPRLITPIKTDWPRWIQIRVSSGIGQFDLGEMEVELNETTKTPVGACMCMTRAIYNKFGPFSENIGRAGIKPYGGEETVLFGQAFENAVKGIYLPRIVVRHEFISAKSTKKYWLRQGFYGGRSYVRMKEIRSGKKIPWQQALKLAAASLFKSISRAAFVASPRSSFENQYRAIAHFGRAYEALGIVLKCKSSREQP
ncbi:glycosyltransferase [Granulosicoccus sp.]|nr:glycosyltransferase family 2 protein [Granulosicoccus sp.]MDB4222421.1 glycosyltransferase [Granulosicoccus sp.]